MSKCSCGFCNTHTEECKQALLAGFDKDIGDHPQRDKNGRIYWGRKMQERCCICGSKLPENMFFTPYGTRWYARPWTSRTGPDGVWGWCERCWDFKLGGIK